MYVYENGYDASEDEYKQVKKIPILGPTTTSTHCVALFQMCTLLMYDVFFA